MKKYVFLFASGTATSTIKGACKHNSSSINTLSPAQHTLMVLLALAQIKQSTPSNQIKSTSFNSKTSSKNKKDHTIKSIVHKSHLRPNTRYMHSN